MAMSIIRCGDCDTGIDLLGNEASCVCGTSRYSLFAGIYVRNSLEVNQENEMLIRDKQAAGYLSHGKFPTQITDFDKWLREIGDTENLFGSERPKIALDLGCGPGPYTKKLQDLGFYVIAIDFSMQSLSINLDGCRAGETETTFVQEDLNKLALVRNSVDLVVMADFLQHLGGRNRRERLLHEVFSALKENSYFYLSFFNLNIKNYIKGDVHGDFAGGMIRYEPLTAKNVIADFPIYMSVDSVRPMNIVHGALLEKVLTALPLSRFFPE